METFEISSSFLKKLKEKKNSLERTRLLEIIHYVNSDQEIKFEMEHLYGPMFINDIFHNMYYTEWIYEFEKQIARQISIDIHGPALKKSFLHTIYTLCPPGRDEIRCLTHREEEKVIIFFEDIYAKTRDPVVFELIQKFKYHIRGIREREAQCILTKLAQK